MARDVNVRIGAKEQVSKASSKAVSAIRGLDKESKRSAKSIMEAWSQATIIVAGMVRAWGQVNNALKKTSDAYRIQIQAEQRLVGAVRATGAALGLSTAAMIDHAEALSQVTEFGDEAIISAQGILAQFGRISGEVMPGATEATLNLAAAMGTDLDQAAQRIGRALAEPSRAAETLRRANILLNESQQDAIEAFIEAGNEASAMGVVLEQVERQFGGFAAAVGQSSVGIIARFENLKGDIQEKVGEIATALKIDFIETITPALEDVLQWFIDNADVIYAVFTNIGPLMGATAQYVVQVLRDAFRWENFSGLIGSLGSGLFGALSTSIVEVITVFGAVFDAISILSETYGADAGTLFVNAFQDALSGIRSSVQDWTEENVTAPIRDAWRNITGQQVEGPGAAPSGPGAGTGVLQLYTFGAPSAGVGARPDLAELLSVVADTIAPVLRDSAKAISDSVSESGRQIAETTDSIFGESTDAFTTAVREILEAGKRDFEQFRESELASPDRRDRDGTPPSGMSAEDRKALAAAELRRRQEALTQALHLSDIAKYGAEYVRLQTERGSVLAAMEALVRAGFDQQAEALRTRLGEIDDIMDSILNPPEDAALSLADALGGTEGMVLAFGDAMGGSVHGIMSAIMAFEWIGLAVVAVQEVMRGLAETIGPLINRILVPVFNYLGLIGQIIGTLLIPVFNALSPIIMLMVQIMSSLLPLWQLLEIFLIPIITVLQILTPIFTGLAIVIEVLMAPVRYLGDLFSWVAQKIRYAVVAMAASMEHPFSERKRQEYIRSQGARDPGRFTSSAFTGLQGRIDEILALSGAAPTAGDFPTIEELLAEMTGITEWGGTGEGGVHGGSVTVQQPPDIYIHIHIGEGGVAVMGDRELRQVGDVVVRSVEEVLGTGGQVSWLPAEA